MRTLLLSLLVACLLASSASAAPIAWFMQGQVSSVVYVYDNAPGPQSNIDALAAEGVAPGASFRGALRFESTTPDSDSDDLFGAYDDGITSFAARIDDWSLRMAVDPFFTTTRINLHGVEAGLPNIYTASTFAVSSPDLFGVSDNNIIQLSFLDSDGDVFLTDALALVPPDLALLDPHDPTQAISLGYLTGMIFFLDTGPNIIAVTGQLTSITLPEPGNLLLLGLGLGALALVRRRR
jgi:hypothetical protein